MDYLGPLRRDPITYDGGSLNLYEYVSAMPLTKVDPFGLEQEDCGAGKKSRDDDAWEWFQQCMAGNKLNPKTGKYYTHGECRETYDNWLGSNDQWKEDCDNRNKEQQQKPTWTEYCVYGACAAAGGAWAGMKWVGRGAATCAETAGEAVCRLPFPWIMDCDSYRTDPNKWY